MDTILAQRLTLQQLKEITHDFSEVIGRGVHTTVYKGRTEDGEVAVHMVDDRGSSHQAVNNQIFLNQLLKLVTLRHGNIVKLVGYCYQTRCEPVLHNGKPIALEKVECIAICLEYSYYGSLRDYIVDENGLDWFLRYKIIKGTCEGLRYLHHRLEEPLCHLNIHPGSILLDVNMEPKLSDFYMSRFILDEEFDKSWSMPLFMTLEHVPPEYLDRPQGNFSKKFDIFSLGILIINIVAGPEGRSRCVKMASQDFIDHVLRNWRSRLELVFTGTVIDAYCQQVEICTNIALNCMEADRIKRPDVVDIISKLNESETIIGMIQYDIRSSLEKVVRVTREYMEEVDESSGKYTKKVEAQIHHIGPQALTFQQLEEMTDRFSEAREISKSTKGVLYKGVRDNGEIITVMVKYTQSDWTGNQFLNEILNLVKLEHENIVRLAGYSYEISKILFSSNRKVLVAEERKQAICMEYFPNGNLEKYLTDDLNRLDWQTRYKIIKGLCDGLKYLHDGLKPPLFQLSINPASIWLDSDMKPKFSDFSFSMFSDEEETGLEGNYFLKSEYVPLEYIGGSRTVSKKFDIFSLGVVILDIVAGPLRHERSSEKPQEFIDLVRGNWRSRLQEVYRGATLDAYCQQVQACIEIALNCIEVDRHKRDNIEAITLILNKTEAQKGFNYQEVWKMSPAMLRSITNDFSEEIGRGGCGTVYKGYLPNGDKVAVKTLNPYLGGNQTKQIQSEEHLRNLEHRNIVRLIGYCQETVKRPVRENDKSTEYIFTSVTESFICYEFVSKGNLEDNLWPKDKSHGPNWQTRYSIIQGICDGLHYLHRDCQKAPIVHRDLKPANILLDDNLVPKLADFGLARMVPKTQAHITEVVSGTSGYMAPEYLAIRGITPKSDIYSLGVMILEIVTGDKCPYGGEESGKFYIEKVRKARKENSYVASTYESLEDSSLLQAQSWISIGLRCTEKLPQKRPAIEDIMHFIETESANSSDNEARGKLRIMSFKELQDMTKNFSIEQLEGKCIFGDVYKGERVDDNFMAVLKLKGKGHSPVQFESQVNHLRFEDKNILQLKGYCYETIDVATKNQDKQIDGVRDQRLLCYEFLPKGTLDRVIFAEESCTQLDWEPRYNIIRDICQTLKYLHEDCENAPQLHMALTPSNIWLDDQMVPKLGLCGLSKLFTTEQTEFYNAGIPLSRGYAAPELVETNKISTKSDIYSAGVLIIEIVTGHKYAPGDNGAFSANVYKTWMKDSHIRSKYKSVDASGLQQVKGCIKVGIHCIENNPDKRPAARELISMLVKECTVGRGCCDVLCFRE